MFRILALLILWMLAFAALAQRAEPMPYQPVQPPRAALVAGDAGGGFIGSGAGVLTVELPEVGTDLASDRPGIRKTGTVYRLPKPVTAQRLSWQQEFGYYTARLRLVSANGARMRVHVVYGASSPVLKLRQQGSDEERPSEPISSSEFASGQSWLPVATGRSLELEIAVVSDRRPDRLKLTIDAVNIMPGSDRRGSAETVHPSLTGDAQEPELDLACWQSDSAYTALTKAAAATALVHFIEDGNSFVCSGTLLNDLGNTNTPWFTTANHCISDQTIADTASFDWLFQAAECGQSSTIAGHNTTSGGARLLFGEFRREISFLRLKKPPGAGAVLSGWDTDIAVNDPVWGVHHPKGDHAMVSRGKVTALQQQIQDASQDGFHVVDEVQFSDGGTESGSSGSGLFATTGNNAYWKGSLFGGAVNDYQLSSYSHFEGYYSQVKRWLEACKLPWGCILLGGKQVTAYAVRSGIDCKAQAETRNCSAGVLSGSNPFQTCEAACELPWGGIVLSGRSAVAYRSADLANCTQVRQNRTCNDGKLSGSYTVAACHGQCHEGWDASTPVADACADDNGNVGDRLRLDGSLSCNTNPPGPKRSRRFSWTQASVPSNADGSDVSFRLRGQGQAKPSFVPPLPGDYRFTLTVGNGTIDSDPATTTVHVGGAIQVTSPFDGGAWTIGDQPLQVSWIFTGISSSRRFNLFLVTGVGSTETVFPLKRRLRSTDSSSGSLQAEIPRNRRTSKMLSTAAAFRVCLPRIGKNDPVCGQSEVFAVQ